MEVPISKFMQSDNYWQSPSTSAFKSPDLIELNSDSERNVKPVEPLNYSSSQEEVETEDDCCDVPESILVKEGIPGVVYDVTSNDEESCHLLQTEDDSENSDSEHVENSSKSSLSRSSSSAEATISDGEANTEERINSRLRHCSLDNYLDMSAEQEKYYTEQFLLLQPDPHGMLTGGVAKGFFEKSKLPLTELREIWQIADVTRDGCLDLAEFKTAMHLVVLRRHGLHIPSHIDGRLEGRPFHALSSNNVPAGSGTGSESNTNPSTSVAQQLLTTPPTRNNNVIHTVSSAPPQHIDRLSKKQPSKDWTTFEQFENDHEPINFSSTCDTSGLVAPVPRLPNLSPPRLTTPEDKLFLSNNNSASVPKSQHLQLKAIQRPKLSGHHPKISTGTIAPPPPPRRKTHVRSSSLDLNRLAISSDSQNQANSLGPEFLGNSAFSVYRKPQPPATATIHEPPSIPSHVVSSKTTKVQLKQEVADLKNENTILNRISTQLLDQLSGLQAKKKALNCKIQQLNTLPSVNQMT